MKKLRIILLSIFSILLTISCEIGLGSSVDTEAPALYILNPPVDSIIRDSFLLSGSYTDDGTVVSWGDPDNGGDSSTVSDKLFDVETIYANDGAFVALRKDGTAISWGDKNHAGNNEIHNVKKIYVDEDVMDKIGFGNDIIEDIDSAIAFAKR